MIDRLQHNVQQSVKEATGGRLTDPNVAETIDAQQDGGKSVGKKVLEGLGLGGDERKTTLRNVHEEAV